MIYMNIRHLLWNRHEMLINTLDRDANAVLGMKMWLRDIKLIIGQLIQQIVKLCSFFDKLHEMLVQMKDNNLLDLNLHIVHEMLVKGVSWLVRIRDLNQYLEKMIPFYKCPTSPCTNYIRQQVRNLEYHAMPIKWL